jgi:hypothetical protein
MDTVTLARLQFGTTIVYHYLFVPLTLGLGLLVAVMETLYIWSGKSDYKRMTQFWGRLFLFLTQKSVAGKLEEVVLPLFSGPIPCRTRSPNMEPGDCVRGRLQ